jgi:hypothetical protein
MAVTRIDAPNGKPMRNKRHFMAEKQQAKRRSEKPLAAMGSFITCVPVRETWRFM